LDQLKANPVGFLAKNEACESVVLMRGSTKVAEVRPEVSVSPELSRPYGLAKEDSTVPDDFNSLLHL
jgi:hypothetical protein